MNRSILVGLLFGLALLAGCVNASSPSTNPQVREPGVTDATVRVTTTTTTPASTQVVTGVVVDDGGDPVAGAKVGTAGTTGPDGTITFDRRSAPMSITAPGFVPRFVNEESADTMTVPLERIVVEGVVETSSGVPYPAVTVTLGDSETTTDEAGRFMFSGRQAATLKVDLPGRRSVEYDWLGRQSFVRLTLDPIVIRAVHVTGWAVTNSELWSHLLDLADDTELNSLVVDLKDESGRVFYPSEVALASEVGATGNEYELKEVVEVVRSHDLYLIGRIVTFQDPIAARAATNIAIWDSATNAPFRKGSQYFLDPTDPDARQYALDLAAEACEAGFDEIQFDYVRYPDGFGSSAVFDGGADGETRSRVIRDFLAQATAILRPSGCAVAADIFGFITSTSGDGGIGQQLEELEAVVDVLSPMLYPSHYSEGWFGFAVPNDHPGPVVSNALDDGLNRLSTAVVMRPWIQDFYYSDAQVRAEIDAAEERGLGWMLWNASSRFAEGALKPAPVE